jgi:hypothetical protein
LRGRLRRCRSRGGRGIGNRTPHRARRRKDDWREHDDKRREQECEKEASVHLWYWIVPTRPERIASRQTAEGKPPSAKRPVALERLDGVGGATWIITARGRKQRRQRDLIRSHQQDEHGARQRGDRTAQHANHYGPRNGMIHPTNRPSCMAALSISLASASNDTPYASGRARMTTSTDGADGRRRVRTSSRNRRFNRLRSTTDPE